MKTSDYIVDLILESHTQLLTPFYEKLKKSMLPSIFLRDIKTIKIKLFY